MEGRLIADRYAIREPIGYGSTARVWRATDRFLEREVAIKIFAERLHGNSLAEERFRREGLAAAAIFDPHVIAVFDTGVVDERPFLVLELVDGPSLSTLLASVGALPWESAARYAADIARALGAAHAAGIVHRDVKPGNVLIAPDGSAKLGDFGVAHDERLAEVALEGSDRVVGSLHYLAPETILGEIPTAASDSYALGVVLFRMLAGVLPFEHRSPLEIALEHVSVAPEIEERLEGRAPRALIELVTALLRKDPHQRPDALDVAATLDAIVATPATQPRDAGDDRRQGDRRHRFARMPLVASVLLLLLVVGTIVTLVARAHPVGPATLVTAPASATVEAPVFFPDPTSAPTELPSPTASRKLRFIPLSTPTPQPNADRRTLPTRTPNGIHAPAIATMTPIDRFHGSRL